MSMDSVLWLIHFLAAHTLPYIHTYIHAYIHTYIHAYIRAYMCYSLVYCITVTLLVHTLVYHAEFRVGKSPILIATDVVGRGLGKP